jgi:hypothetical protein
MLSILPNSILTGGRRLFYESNLPDFKSEFGVSDILIVITLILTIFLALLPMLLQKAERKRYLLLVFGRFVGNAKKISTDKISELYSKLLIDLFGGIPEIKRTYLSTAYEEIKSLDRNNIYELLKSHKAFQGSGGFDQIHDKLSKILEYCDEWIFKLEQYNLLYNDIFNRFVSYTRKSYDLLDKVDLVVFHNNFQASLNSWPNGNALITVITNFFQVNAGATATIDRIMTDLVDPSLTLIRQDPIHYPQTPECTEFAELIRDIERLNAQQNVFHTKILNEIDLRKNEAIMREEIFDKMIPELKKINNELL